MTEISLDKNLCLEELTYAWCESECDFDKARGISFCKATKKEKRSIWFREYFTEGSCDYGGETVFAKAIATFYPHNQKLVIHNIDKFEPVLESIKAFNHTL